MAGSRRARGVTPRSLASFDADAPAAPTDAPEIAPEPPGDAPPPPVRLERSSIRSLEVRRNRWIRERLARERRPPPEASDSVPVA